MQRTSLSWGPLRPKVARALSPGVGILAQAGENRKMSKSASTRRFIQLDSPYVLGLKTLRSLDHVELDRLAFLE